MHRGKVLFVHQGFEMYGSDKSFLSFCQKQSIFDSEKTDIIISREGPLSQILEKSPYNLSYLGMGRLPMYLVRKRPLKYVILLYKDIRKALMVLRGYDYIYINTIAPFAWIMASAILNKRRCIHVREIPKKLVSFPMSLFMLNNCKIIFNSTASLVNFRSVFSLNSAVVNNGVESLRFKASDGNSYPHIFKADSFNVLFPGRINAWKGQDFVLECIREFGSSFEDINWIFAGDVAINQEWRYDQLKQIMDYDSIETINFLGWRDDLTDLMQNSDLVIVPSVNPEPFGRVVIEAMSMGKIVLASGHGGPADIIESGENGFLFEPLNKENFKDLLLTIKNLSCMERRKVEGAAIQEFESKYSEQIYLNNLSNELKKHFT